MEGAVGLFMTSSLVNLASRDGLRSTYPVAIFVATVELDLTLRKTPGQATSMVQVCGPILSTK